MTRIERRRMKEENQEGARRKVGGRSSVLNILKDKFHSGRKRGERLDQGFVKHEVILKGGKGE